jgi:EmrB/QacA subfamily drug resistance transporter
MNPTKKAAQVWVLALTSAASLMVALDQLVVATALSTIREDLHASIETLEWTVNAYTLTFAVLLMTGAALGDRLGRRRMFVSGLALFTAASAACALAPSIGWLILARAVQGTGSALVMPLAMALLSAAFPPETRGRALGLFTGLTGVAVVGGPIVGGAVTEDLAWQWIFWVNIPIGLLVVPLVFARIEESFGPRTRIDVPGLALATGGALGLVWGLVRGNSQGWTSAEVVATLAAGALLCVAFVAWEVRAEAPMLPMGFFRTPAFAAGNAATFLMYGSLFSSVFFVAQYLQVSLGYGPLGAGVRTLAWTCAIFFVAPAAGALTDRIGARALIGVGLSMQAAGIGWIALNVHDGRPYSSSVAALVIAGCGISMAMPAVQNAIIGSVPHGAIGKASGTFNTLRQLGGVFGVAILAATFAANGSYASPAAFGDGTAPALAVAAGMSLLAGMIGLATPGRRVRRPEVAPLPAQTPVLVGEGGSSAAR